MTAEDTGRGTSSSRSHKIIDGLGERGSAAVNEWSEEILRFLLQARQELSATFDYESTLQVMAQLAVPRMADWCAVDIVQEGGHLERLAVRHVDPSKVERIFDVERRFERSESASRIFESVMGEGKSVLVTEFSDDMLRRVASSEEHLELMRSLEIGSLMVVPLVARSNTFGTLTLAAGKSGRQFTESDLALAHELAANAGTIIDNARLYWQSQRELAERERIQAELTELNAELEIRVARRTEQLERTNEELEAFSYSVSHDLRAPLRAIHGFSQIVVEDYSEQLPEDAVELLREVQDNARHMGVLIDDLLAFSRLSRQAVNRRSVGMTDQVRQALDTLQNELTGRQVDIQVAELPDAHADPALVRQLLINILSNALKYSRKRELARVEVGWYGEPDEPVYFVRDNGAGFDMRYVGKLFGVFQRLHLAEEYEGTGVGLALVQRIVSRHGGRVWAEGEVDRGATFYFTLPASREEEHDG